MTSRPGTWGEEPAAAALMGGLLNGEPTSVDPGGGSVQLHDFDLALPSGKVIAVEVTRHTHEATLATQSATDKQRWEYPFLGYHWHLSMTQTFNVKAAAKHLPGLMRAVESSGLEAVILRAEVVDGSPEEYLGRDKKEMRSVIRERGIATQAQELFDLGVRAVLRLGPATDGNGALYLGQAPVGGATASHLLTEVATVHASKPDNLAKLRSAVDHDERHLFVWVESSATAASAAFGSLRISGVPPEPRADESIDAIWLVSAFENAHVLCWRRNEGWSDLGRHTLR